MLQGCQPLACQNTSNLPTSDDLTQIAWQIAQTYQLIVPRAPCVYQQVIPVSGPPGRVYQAFRQLPAQSPDVIQRVYVVQPGRDMIDLVIQGAQATGPVYQDQTVCQASQPPTIYPRIVQPTSYSVASMASVAPVAPVMPTMAAVPVGMAAYQTPMTYGAYAMPSFVANTSPFPVAYGTRAFPRAYPGRGGAGRFRIPFY